MAETFTVVFDRSGKIVSVTDTAGKTTLEKDFGALVSDPFPDLSGVTVTEVCVTSTGCYVHQNCRKVKVC
jgi:hypothetical protein